MSIYKRRLRLGHLLLGIITLLVVTAGTLAFSSSEAGNHMDQDDIASVAHAIPDISEAVATEEAGEFDPDHQKGRASFSGPSVFCGSGGGGLSTGPPDSPESLAWISHEVVRGTVVENLGPQWGPESMTGVGDQFDNVPLRSISTEYLVEVNDRIRGNPEREIRVGIEGGTIDDCTIGFHGPTLERGEEVVLFLAERNVPDTYAAQDTDDRPVYRLTSSMVGIWTFTEQNAITPKQLLEEADPGHSNDAAILEHFTYDWSELRQRLIISLASGEAPEGEFRPIEIVRLEDAPLQVENH